MPNLAARLCGEAKDGQILIDNKVRSAVEGVAELEPLEALVRRRARATIVVGAVPLSTFPLSVRSPCTASVIGVRDSGRPESSDSRTTVCARAADAIRGPIRPASRRTAATAVPTWMSSEIARLLDRYLGAEWQENHDDPSLLASLSLAVNEPIVPARSAVIVTVPAALTAVTL